jgi:hypothetical protein
LSTIRYIDIFLKINIAIFLLGQALLFNEDPETRL